MSEYSNYRKEDKKNDAASADPWSDASAPQYVRKSDNPDEIDARITEALGRIQMPPVNAPADPNAKPIVFKPIGNPGHKPGKKG